MPTNGTIWSPKRHKFGAVRKEYNGVMYDSTLEALRAAELDLLVRQASIDSWTRQITVPLGEDFKTVVDFCVFDPCGERWWYEEAKGYETPAFKRVRRLWKKYGPLPLLIYKMVKGRWQIETLPAAAQERADG